MDPITILNQRLNKGLSQRQLAGELGISPQYLNDILQLRKEAGPAVLAALGIEKRVTYRKISEPRDSYA